VAQMERRPNKGDDPFRKIIPAEESVKRTLAGRRKRLGNELRQRLEEADWQLIEGTTAHTYKMARGDDRT